MKEALLWEALDEGYVRCNLCAHRCRIAPGKRGICGVRENRDGVLYSLVYGEIVAINSDPIEKKPLFHFLPGSYSLSIATVGCNFRCLHCQNSDISQMPRDEGRIVGRYYSPSEVINYALSYGCESISYTYTEPTVFFEFTLDCSIKAKENGIKNVYVTNGFMSLDAIKLISPYLDAANIDLKGSDEFYRKICGGRRGPVEDSIKALFDAGVWVEVTTLIIPGHNDGEDDLVSIARFIKGLSPDIPWHVTAFYPTYRMRDVRPASLSDVKRAYDIGKSEGLKHVYIGNVWGTEGENTFCPSCGNLLIRRSGYIVTVSGMDGGRCKNCGAEIKGVWS